MTSTQHYLVRFLGVGTLGAALFLWCLLAGCFQARAVDTLEVEPVVPTPSITEALEANGGGTGTSANTPEVDLRSRPLPRIPAGTVIGKTAPKGWSNFLMIAIPTLTKEDLADAPKIASHYARMFKFTLLAKTEKQGGRYVLNNVSRGFAMDVRGREIIVESKNTFGGKVGVFGDRILAENEKHIDADVRQVAKTSNMLLFDAQAVMRQGRSHVRMILRHAIVIDPSTGKPYTFVWLLSRNRVGYAIAEREMQLIPEGMREARYLSVKRDKFVLGLPTPEAFALVQTPQGKPIKWTPSLQNLASIREFTSDQVLELENLLLGLGRQATH